MKTVIGNYSPENPEFSHNKNSRAVPISAGVRQFVRNCVLTTLSGFTNHKDTCAAVATAVLRCGGAYCIQDTLSCILHTYNVLHWEGIAVVFH